MVGMVAVRPQANMLRQTARARQALRGISGGVTARAAAGCGDGTTQHDAGRELAELLGRQSRIGAAAHRRSDQQPEWIPKLVNQAFSGDKNDGLLKYLVSSHHKVHGYFEVGMAAVLAILSSVQHGNACHGSSVEIGVFRGASFFPLLLLTEPSQVAVGIDCFEDQGANRDGSGFGKAVPSIQQFEASLRSTVSNPDVCSRAKLWRCDSRTLQPQDVLSKLPNGQGVKVFSIDGCHEAAATELDCHLAANCLAPGGIIMVDDVFNSHWPGVSTGLQAFLTKRDGIDPFFIGFNKVLLCHSEFHGIYYEAASSLPSACKTSQFMNHKVSIHRQGWITAMYGND